MTEKTAKLPNMNEFSPGVIPSLRALLKTVKSKEGDKEAIQKAIANSTPAIKKTPGKQRHNRANNVLIGMSQCGLFNLKKSRLTNFGNALATARSNSKMNELFTRQLLVGCHGLDLLDAVEVIRARGESVKLQTIREELRARGFHVTENEGNASKIRKWMEPSGVVDKDWNFSNEVLSSLVGAESSTLGEWRGLTKAQRILVRKIKEHSDAPDPGWVDLAPLKRIAEAEWGRSLFPEGAFRKKIVEPLEARGWIKTEGKGKGRGGNIGRARAESKLLDISVQLPLDVETAIPVDLRDKVSTPLEQILKDLKSSDKHKKGIALELLALRLIRDLGLKPVAFRLRGSETGGAEVDVVAHGIHLHYSRWLFQCKNTKQVALADIAKEVGMAVYMKAHVVVMVTTGKFAGTVTNYAKGIAESTALQAILISGDLLKKYESAGAMPVIEALKVQAEGILAAKQSQVGEQG